LDDMALDDIALAVIGPTFSTDSCVGDPEDGEPPSVSVIGL
jgi:hypothetical protein